ncbi:META domain-containing protein [Streptomyces sp. NPDC007088]|uniref:META domain-containing protein n=1 Tax=Streptomyces sp. NPDC007088 TaxID=3364773 RepID=UPI003678583C
MNRATFPGRATGRSSARVTGRAAGRVPVRATTGSVSSAASLAVLTVCATVLTACGTGPAGSGAGHQGGGAGETGAGTSVSSAEPPAYTGVSWSVESVTADGKRHRAPEGARLAFDTSARTPRAEGDYGCNRFSSPVRFTDERGGRLRLSEPVSTRRACGKPVMAFEKKLSGLLTGNELTAHTERRTGPGADRLTLTTPEGDAVNLRRSEDKGGASAGRGEGASSPGGSSTPGPGKGGSSTPGPGKDGSTASVPLTETTWEITRLLDGTESGGDGQGSRRVSPGAHLRLAKDGKVTGSLGCNRFSARAELDGDRLRIDRPVTTRMLCQGEAMDTEKALLKLFASPLRHAVADGTLTLTAENGTGLRAVPRA